MLTSSSPQPSQLVQIGKALFKYRSFTPVPVIALLLGLLWRSRSEDGPGGAVLDACMNALGLLVASAGQALRFYTLGQAREGTSGQGSILQATALNTRGPYAYVRNPLYVGNLGICLGLLLIAHDPWVYLAGLAFFFGEYFFIIHAEEEFLLETHGNAYRDYLRDVPRWIPRRTPASPGRLNEQFDWQRALKKEHNPFAAWGVGAILLLSWELTSRGRLTPVVMFALAATNAAVLTSFAIIKMYKRGWLFPSSAPGGHGQPGP